MDSFSGLYYGIARWYDPVTGRWVSRDPRSQGENALAQTCSNKNGCSSNSFFAARTLPYLFCENNALVYYDADGNQAGLIGGVGYAFCFGWCSAYSIGGIVGVGSGFRQCMKTCMTAITIAIGGPMPPGAPIPTPPAIIGKKCLPWLALFACDEAAAPGVPPWIDALCDQPRIPGGPGLHPTF
jgi:RHS repeat-associated protein